MEPWGTMPADVRVGMICALFANAHRQKNAAAMSVEDFMPKWGQSTESKRRATVDEVRAMLMSAQPRTTKGGH